MNMDTKTADAFIEHVNRLTSKDQVKSLWSLFDCFEYTHENERVLAALKEKEGSFE